MAATDLEEMVMAQNRLRLAQAGELAAMQVTVNALIGVIGTNFPPLLSPLTLHLDALRSIVRPTLETESLSSFDATLGGFQDGITALHKP